MTDVIPQRVIKYFPVHLFLSLSSCHYQLFLMFLLVPARLKEAKLIYVFCLLSLHLNWLLTFQDAELLDAKSLLAEEKITIL